MIRVILSIVLVAIYRVYNPVGFIKYMLLNISVYVLLTVIMVVVRGIIRTPLVTRALSAVLSHMIDWLQERLVSIVMAMHYVSKRGNLVESCEMAGWQHLSTTEKEDGSKLHEFVPFAGGSTIVTCIEYEKPETTSN